MIRRLLFAALLLAAAAAAAQSSLESRRAEVFAAERAFARSMADRDFAAFGRYVAADCVFFGQAALHGREAVLEGPISRAALRQSEAVRDATAWLASLVAQP